MTSSCEPTTVEVIPEVLMGIGDSGGSEALRWCGDGNLEHWPASWLVKEFGNVEL